MPSESTPLLRAGTETIEDEGRLYWAEDLHLLWSTYREGFEWKILGASVVLLTAVLCQRTLYVVLPQLEGYVVDGLRTLDQGQSTTPAAYLPLLNLLILEALQMMVEYALDRATAFVLQWSRNLLYINRHHTAELRRFMQLGHLAPSLLEEVAISGLPRIFDVASTCLYMGWQFGWVWGAAAVVFCITAAMSSWCQLRKVAPTRHAFFDAENSANRIQDDGLRRSEEIDLEDGIETESALLEEGLRETRKAGMAYNDSNMMVGLALDGFVLLGSKVGLAVVIYEVCRGVEPVGKYVTAFSLLGKVGKTLKKALKAVQAMQMTLDSINKVRPMLRYPPSVEDPTNPAALQRGACGRSITIANLVYTSPSPHRREIFKSPGLNIQIAAGQFVAIVGANGQGKSTLVRLLTRELLPDAGSISIDGIDTRRLTRDDLRKPIACLLQGHRLPSRSIAGVVGRHQLTISDVERACDAAGVHERISELGDGYDTELDENASFLSGGERQRIGIASMLTSRCEILILDEPTSAVDARTELDVISNLRDITTAKGQTCILITHRLTTIKNADLIVVLADGIAAETGKHEELLDAGGVYAALWTSSSTKVDYHAEISS